MTNHVVVDVKDGVTTLTLARPEKKNALTDDMYRRLADEIDQLESDPNRRCLVLRGEGSSFTAGNDLADFASVGTENTSGDRHVHRFLRALAMASKPIVAAVRGRAVGVGTTMLLHCDIVILAEDAVLSSPFVGLGLVPEAASSLLLPARIGHVRAFEMLVLGRAVGAREALEWGLANQVVAGDALERIAADYAKRLAQCPADAVRGSKRLMRSTQAMLERIEEENVEFAVRLRSPEAQAAFAAFAQRRGPGRDNS